jgi:hypothetical protein
VIVDVLAVVLLVLPPIDWLVAVRLVTISREHPDILTLRERSWAAVICAIVATTAGVLAWARLGIIQLPSGSAVILIALGLVLASVPSLYWGWLLVTGRFRGEP